MARTHLGLAIFAGVSLFAPTAEAGDGPRTLFGQPVNDPPEMTQEEIEARAAGLAKHLDEQGLVLQGKQVLPKRVLTGDLYLPPGVSEAGEWTQPPHRTTTFLNFFGGPMKGGLNAAEGESPCIQGNVDYPGYSGKEQAALAIIQVFKDAAEPFGVRIAYDKVPPKHLPYSQVMMGGGPGIIGLPNGVLGVSCNLDCGDQWWRDTTFAFTEQSGDAGVLGVTALQESAHSWGLDHIDGESNIMYPYATFGTKVWADECTPYNAATGGIGCTSTHDIFCGGGMQSDVAELTAYFGVNSPDTIAPTVVMMEPANPSMWHAGDTVHISVEVSDDHEGFGWRLMVPELGQEQPVYNGQKEWDLKPPKGAFTIRVEAIDHDRNVGFAEAKIYVDVEPPVEGTDTDTDSDSGDTGTLPTSGASEGGDEGNSSDGGGDEDGATTPITDTNAQTGDDKGCGCRSQGEAPVWLLSLGLLGLRRRVRRA